MGLECARIFHVRISLIVPTIRRLRGRVRAPNTLFPRVRLVLSMEENKDGDLVPFSESEGTKKIPIKKICVKLYLSEPEFYEWIAEAEKAGIRPRGLKPFRVKAHGFAGERIANTKGLVKFVKKVIMPFWKRGEKERIEREARIKREAAELGLKVGE